MSGRGIVLILAIISLTAMTLFGTAGGGTILVDDDGGPSVDYDNIQEAINNSAPGDTIQVFDGEYHQRLVVDRRLTIESAGGGEVVVDADKNGTAITITADDVVLDDLTVINSRGSPSKPYGIYIDGASNVVIRDCSIQQNGYGIFSDGCSWLTVKDVYCERNDRTILIKNSDNLTLEGIVITRSGHTGIWLDNCTDARIGPSTSRSTSVANSQYGVRIQDRCNRITAEFVGSTFSLLGLDVKKSRNIDASFALTDVKADGVKVDNGTGVNLTGLIETEVRGLYIRYSEWVNLTELDIRCPVTKIGTGMRLLHATNVRANVMNITGFHTGIRMETGARALLDTVDFVGGGTYNYTAYVDDSALDLIDPGYLSNATPEFTIFGGGYVSIKNRIRLKVVDGSGNPQSGADLRVSNEEGVIYGTSHFGGSDPVTDAQGLTPDIVMAYLLLTDVEETYYNMTTVDVHTASWDGSVEGIDTSSPGTVKIVTNDPAEIDWQLSYDAPLTSAKDIYITVTYVDKEGIEATIHRVYIDNVSHEMTKHSGDPVSGSLYEYMTRLPQGEHWIYFQFNDSVVDNVTVGFSILVLNAPPGLTNMSVVKELPNWTFYVTYADTDGDGPREVHLIFEGDNITMGARDNSTNYTAGKVFNVTLSDLANGRYIYRFTAFDGNGWSATEAFILDVDEDRPVLSGLSVTPTSGNASVAFEFRVTYSHLGAIPPDGNISTGAPTLHIGNLSFRMTPVDPEDDDVVFGKEYYVKRAGIPHGNYSFYATATDGTFSTRTVLRYLVVNNSAPMLSFDYFPKEGLSGTFYHLKITFTDLDDDMPGSLTVTVDTSNPYSIHGDRNLLAEDDYGDTSTFNGKVYWLNQTFYHGLRRYTIRADDGDLSTNLTGNFPVDMRPQGVVVSRWPQTLTEEDSLKIVCQYIDGDNDRPEFINITFTRTNDTGTYDYGPFEMSEVDGKDDSYWDGKEYAYSGEFKAQDDRFGPGAYTFRITMSDGYLTTVLEEPEFIFYVQPADRNPELLDPTVSPLGGNTDTPITFRVTYRDPDGDPPDVIYILANLNRTNLQKISGDDYTEGVIYGVTVPMVYPGEYTIQFAARSGSSDLVKVTAGVLEIQEEKVDTGEDKGSDFMLIIVAAAVIPIVVAVVLGLIFRRTRPSKTVEEEEEEEEE
ncbi:MAG TPA: hypothetical protein EYP43_03790, partial [Thermoplasmata archaeon]|nr:hypothetical protein [Thermoplasmata archaeon]